MNNKEQKTIKAIQVAVPEIMELKRECKFEDDNKEKTILVLSEITSRGNYILFSEKTGKLIYRIPKITLDKLEIIGRDITLEDCLIAINKNTENWRKKFWYTWVFPECGGNWKNNWIPFCGYSHKKGMSLLVDSERKPIGWIPNKPFHLQSQETKDLIGDLILSK